MYFKKKFLVSYNIITCIDLNLIINYIRSETKEIAYKEKDIMLKIANKALSTCTWNEDFVFTC